MSGDVHPNNLVLLPRGKETKFYNINNKICNCPGTLFPPRITPQLAYVFSALQKKPYLRDVD